MIESYIKSELDKYAWPSKYDLISNSPFYYLIFPKCKIILYNNKKYSSMECRISYEEDTYSLSEVLRYNNYDKSIYFNESGVSYEKYIEQFINIINENLAHIIEGNFQSLEKMKVHYKNTKIIQDKMKTSFVFETEIYKKMMLDDKTWYEDLNQFAI